jgi:WD40 repeat protein
MLILQSALRNPTGLAFSPDGASLLAVSHNTVQVWPRWLDAPPNDAQEVQTTLERYAFSPDGALIYLYVSGGSWTRVLNVATGEENQTRLPSAGPSWFHFTAAGGFVLVGHGHGQLTRFNYIPKLKSRLRKAWTIERPCGRKGQQTHGSHYRFGGISGPAGVFVALEYRYGRDEPFDGLAVRSVVDGALVRRHKLKLGDATALLADAGSWLAIHPSGGYFAYPDRKHVRLWPLAKGVNVPERLPAFRVQCRAVAFHPSGSFLAATTGAAVTLYDTATWRVIRTLVWEVGELRAVCFTQDGTRGAVIGSGELRGRKKVGGRVVVWDVDQ